MPRAVARVQEIDDHGVTDLCGVAFASLLKVKTQHNIAQAA